MAQATKLRMIQLWTNCGGKEFALRLEDADPGIFIAATHLGTDYPFMVEQFSWTGATECEWEVILQERADKWGEGSNIRDVLQSKELMSDGNIRESQHSRRTNTIRAKRVRPMLKCHFCYLMYNTDDDRLEHEKMWHAAKLQTRAQCAPLH